MPDLTQDREDAGAERCQIGEVVAVDTLDPASVTAYLSGIPNADGHCAHSKRKPARPEYGLRGLSLSKPVAGITWAQTSSCRPERPSEPTKHRPGPKTSRGRRPEQQLPGCRRQPARVPQ